MKSIDESDDSQKIALASPWIDIKLCTLALPGPKNNPEYQLLIERVKAETLAELNSGDKKL